MVRKENIIIGAGLLISIVAIAHLVKAEDGGGGDNLVDKDAVVSDWEEWSKCSSAGSQTRRRRIIRVATGNGTTPSLTEQRDCEPKKEDDPIAWENWNSTRIINEYKNGNLTWLEAYNALDSKHGWSNNDITEALVKDAENISFISSSQSYMSEFY